MAFNIPAGGLRTTHDFNNNAFFQGAAYPGNAFAAPVNNIAPIPANQPPVVVAAGSIWGRMPIGQMSCSSVSGELVNAVVAGGGIWDSVPIGQKSCSPVSGELVNAGVPFVLPNSPIVIDDNGNIVRLKRKTRRVEKVALPKKVAQSKRVVIKGVEGEIGLGNLSRVFGFCTMKGLVRGMRVSKTWNAVICNMSTNTFAIWSNVCNRCTGTVPPITINMLPREFYRQCISTISTDFVITLLPHQLVLNRNVGYFNPQENNILTYVRELELGTSSNTGTLSNFLEDKTNNSKK